MKKSVTVLGVEAAGVRGVRLEENGADWNCVDSGFWPIGGEGGNGSPGSDEEVFKTDGPSIEVDSGLSADDRYAALVGALKDASKRFGTDEIVLSMPLPSLLVKISRTPVDERDGLSEAANAELGKVSPFPAETPVVGIETVAETDRELVTMFAALPESGAVEIGDALDEAGLRVVRTDVTALGWLRSLWPRIMASQGRRTEEGAEPDVGTDPVSRLVVLLNFDGDWDVVILDDGTPTLLRGLGEISDPVELGREITLSVLQAGAGSASCEMVVFSRRDVSPEIVERLGMFGPVRVERVDEADADWGVDGVARRTVEGASLDVTPADWAELREESRFNRKLKAFLSVAAAGWVLAMGTLFGGPMVYDRLTERQKTICRRHLGSYKEVKDMQDKVELVKQYSDHARGTLEMLKAVSDRMPEGVTLTSFNYRRGEKLSLVGETTQPTFAYDFKNALTDAVMVSEEAKPEDDGESSRNEEKLFATVTLSDLKQGRNGHRFSIECLFDGDGSAKEGDE